MKLRSLILATALTGTANAATTVPLKPGTYVLASVSCTEPPLASLFSYDGKQFSFPHASMCHSVVQSHSGKTYRVETRCSALGDGSPAVPTTIASTYRIDSGTRVRVDQGQTSTDARYRWCPAHVVHRR